MVKIQKINIADQHASCQVCGADITDINNFHYAGKTNMETLWFEELCVCLNCGTQFLIHYDIFNSDGHINPRTFTGDVNNLEYNWQDNLTDEQKSLIAKHLHECPACCDRLSEEQLLDAWFGSIIKVARESSTKG